MKKTIIAIIIFIMCALALCGWKFKSVKTNISFWTDTKTGVEYVLYGDGARGGICPRYNADGTLYTSGEE